MSDGDEESSETPDETAVDPVVTEFEDRLDAAEEALETAETEGDLDDVETTLDDIETDLEEAEIEVPEPEDEDEEPDDPKEPLEDELSDLRDEVADQRGPYDEDVMEAIEDARTTITDTRWAQEGEGELVEPMETFLDTVREFFEREFGAPVADTEELSVTLEQVIETVESAGLDADEDAETIADLLEAAEKLQDGVEAATAWTDLKIRERLHREGFYEPLEEAKHKDFPPEWSALKTWEKRGNVEMVVLLLDLMGDTDFIARHCIESLQYMGDAEGIDPLIQLANRRDLNAVDAIGKIGAEEGIDAVAGHIDADNNPAIQTKALTALGAIGSEETAADVAQQLTAETQKARSAAARALGMIGDTRAIDPLGDVLSDTDEAEPVRASAAWALYEIGTERALEIAAEYAEDGSYLVEQEATKASEALEGAAQPA